MTAAAMPTAGLREVRLYGHLRARFGRSHWLAVDSAAEAVRALSVLFKGFREAVRGHRGPGYRAILGEADGAFACDADALTLRAGRARVIRIAPVIHGGKRGGLLQTIIGVTLLVVGIFTGNPYLIKAGAVLTLGGVIQMLSPQRKRDTGADSEASYGFGGGANVTEPGGPVPLVIGRMVVTSTEASAGISTDEYKPAGGALPGNPALPGNDKRDIFDDYYNGI